MFIRQFLLPVWLYISIAEPGGAADGGDMRAFRDSQITVAPSAAELGRSAAKIMVLHDYNGSGRWTRAAILSRYRELVRCLDVATPSDLQPLEVIFADNRRVYPVMDRVIEGIARGDTACIELGVEFIEEDQPFPFGRLLKSNAARALRRAELTPSQRERVRQRVIEMLIAGNTP